MSYRVLFLDSSYPINTRSQRIIDSLADCDVHVCTWDRGEALNVNESQYSVFSTPHIGYGNRLSKLASLFQYACFYRKVIKRFKPHLIIASHWDMLIISALLKGNSKLIYDNVDIPEFKVSLIEKLIVYFEKLALKKVDCTLLASRFYMPLYSKTRNVVLENLPIPTYNSQIEKRVLVNNQIKLGFVGSVRHYELLRNLLLAVNQINNVELHIFGGGIAEEKLKVFCKEKNIDSVIFHGRFQYEQIENIYSKIDILWAAYPYKSRNVKYAISNKFYESIYYSIPCLFSENTMLGNYVTTKNIGVTVDPYSVDSIIEGVSLIIKKFDFFYESLLNFDSKAELTWHKNEVLIKELVKELSEND